MKRTFVRPLGTFPQTPAPVQNLVATVISSTEIDLSWTPIAGAQNYTVRQNGNPINTGAASTFNNTGLTPSTTYSYTVAAINTFGEGLPSAKVSATTNAGGSIQIKWHPGFYMASNNLNGSRVGGNNRNQNEFNVLAASGANLKGWQGIYTWDNLETADGTYNFSPLVADFNDLQATLPGARFGVMIWCEKFSGTGAVGLGIPGYILSNSAYGAGSDGTHFGYWNLDFGGGQSGATAALWRANVNDRYCRVFEHLASTSFVTTAGPYNGQTFTFDTHPLVEFIFNQETSLSLQAGSDYNDVNFVTQFNNQESRLVAAFPHTLIGPQINYTQNVQNIATPVNNLSTVGPPIAMSAPDVYSGAEPGAASWGQKIYVGQVWNGSAFVSGGTDLRGTIPCIGIAQQATYARSTTPAAIIANMKYLQCSHALLTYCTAASQAGYDWNANVLPAINAAVPLGNTACPVSFGNRCNTG